MSVIDPSEVFNYSAIGSLNLLFLSNFYHDPEVVGSSRAGCSAFLVYSIFSVMHSLTGLL